MARGRFKTSTTLQDIERNMRADGSLASKESRRRSGRVHPELVRCNLGTILDLSATGLRVRTHRRLRGTNVVVLRDGDYAVCVRAEVVWSIKRGFRRHEMGLEFIELTQETAGVLRAMALRG